MIDGHLIKEGGHYEREGTIRDITKQVELQRKLDETTEDIERLLHTFRHPLTKFAGNAELLAQMGVALIQSTYPDYAQWRSVLDMGRSLRVSIEDLLTLLAAKQKLPVFTDSLLAIRFRLDYAVKSEKKQIILRSMVRAYALETLRLILSHGKPGGDIEVSECLDKCAVVCRRILHEDVTETAKILASETKAMDHTVEALRQFLGSQRARTYFFENTDLDTVLQENVARYMPLFEQRNLRLEYSSKGNLFADISRHDIDRVISNILLNALKYSKTGMGRFTKVEAGHVEDGTKVEFSVRSYGVPIKQEEIDSKRIFQYGGRGQFARESDRTGIGAGLADAWETVVNGHHGTIKVTSTASKPDDPPKYKVPYITTVVITLPKMHKEKN